MGVAAAVLRPPVAMEGSAQNQRARFWTKRWRRKGAGGRVVLRSDANEVGEALFLVEEANRKRTVGRTFSRTSARGR
jgi:hypothetical protein